MNDETVHEMENTTIVNNKPNLTEKEAAVLQSGESLKILPSPDNIQGSPRSRYIDTPMPPSFECSSPQKNGRTDFFRFEPVSPSRGKRRYSSTDRRHNTTDGRRSVGSPRTGLIERRPKTSRRRTPEMGRLSSATRIEDNPKTPFESENQTMYLASNDNSVDVDNDTAEVLSLESAEDWLISTKKLTDDVNNCAPKDVLYSRMADADQASDDAVRKTRDSLENHADKGSFEAETINPHADKGSFEVETSNLHADKESFEVEAINLHADKESLEVETIEPHVDKESLEAATFNPHADKESLQGETVNLHADKESLEVKTINPHADKESLEVSTFNTHADKESLEAETINPDAEKESLEAATFNRHADKKSLEAKTINPHADNESLEAETINPYADKESLEAATFNPHADKESLEAETINPHAAKEGLEAETINPDFEKLETLSRDELMELYKKNEALLTEMTSMLKTAEPELAGLEGEIEAYLEDYQKRRPQVDFVYKKFGEVSKVYNNFTTEATRLRIAAGEKETSGDMLWDYNREIEGSIAEMFEDIKRMEERKDLSHGDFVNEINEKHTAVEEVEAEIEETKTQLEEMRKNLNLLKIEMTDKGLSVTVPSLAKSFDGTNPLPENLRVDLFPPLGFVGSSYRFRSSVPQTDQAVHDTNRNRAALNPHEVLYSPSNARSLLHWLRCCSQRFNRVSSIPAPVFYLPHGTIRYSETYTVNMRKPMFLQYNQCYNRADWLPTDLELTSLPYIPGVVPHKTMDKQSLIQSPLYWLNCCNFRVSSKIPPPRLILHSPDDDGELTARLSDSDEKQENLADQERCVEQTAAHKCHTEKPQDTLRNTNILSEDVSDDHDTLKSSCDVPNTQQEEVANHYHKKVIKSKIDTGLSKGGKLPAKSVTNKTRSGKRASVCNAKSAPVVSDMPFTRSNLKRITSKIDTGLTTNSKRVLPIAAGPNLISGMPSLSAHTILPPIKSGLSSKLGNNISSSIGKRSVKAVLPPVKSAKRNAISGSESQADAKSFAKKSQFPPLKQPLRITNKPNNTKTSVLPVKRSNLPTTGRLPPLKQHMSSKKVAAAPRPRAVPDSKSRPLRLALLKQSPVSPGQVGSSVATRASLTPLPAIRTSDTSINKSPRKGQGLVRPSSSCNGFGYDIPRNDYY